MIEVETGIKLTGVGTKTRARHHANNKGRFVRAGTSLAPSSPGKVKEGKRNYKPEQHEVADSRPYMLFARNLKDTAAYRELRSLKG